MTCWIDVLAAAAADVVVVDVDEDQDEDDDDDCRRIVVCFRDQPRLLLQLGNTKVNRLGCFVDTKIFFSISKTQHDWETD